MRKGIAATWGSSELALKASTYCDSLHTPARRAAVVSQNALQGAQGSVKKTIVMVIWISCSRRMRCNVHEHFNQFRHGGFKIICAAHVHAMHAVLHHGEETGDVPAFPLTLCGTRAPMAPPPIRQIRLGGNFPAQQLGELGKVKMFHVCQVHEPDNVPPHDGMIPSLVVKVTVFHKCRQSRYDGLIYRVLVYASKVLRVVGIVTITCLKKEV